MGGVLILDDNIDHLVKFRAGFVNVPLCMVATAGAAVQALQRGAFDVLFLDHEHAICNGTLVAAWVVEHYKFFPWLTKCTYIVHTTNSVNAKRISMMLKRVQLSTFISPNAWSQPTLIDGLSRQIKKKAKNSLI